MTLRTMCTKSYCIIVKLCQGLSVKITHMKVKIKITPDYEDEKKTFSLKQITLSIAASSDTVKPRNLELRLFEILAYSK